MNVPLPIDVTELGILILDRELQPLNVYSRSDVTELGMFISERELQL